MSNHNIAPQPVPSSPQQYQHNSLSLSRRNRNICIPPSAASRPWCLARWVWC